MRDVCALPRRAVPERGHDIHVAAHLVHGIHRGAALHVLRAEVAGAILLEGCYALVTTLCHIEGKGCACGLRINVCVSTTSNGAHHQAVVVIVCSTVQLVIDDAGASIEQARTGQPRHVIHQRLSQAHHTAWLHLAPFTSTDGFDTEQAGTIDEAVTIGVRRVVRPAEVLRVLEKPFLPVLLPPQEAGIGIDKHA